MSEPFGAVLKRIREKHSQSQRKLGINYGQLTGRPDGIAPSVIGKWEAGERTPSRDVIKNLSVSLRATPAELDELLVAAGYLPEGNELPDGTRFYLQINGAKLSDSESMEVMRVIGNLVQKLKDDRKDQAS